MGKAEEGLKRLKWDNVISRQLPHASMSRMWGALTAGSGCMAPTNTLWYPRRYHPLDVWETYSGTGCTPEPKHGE